MALFKDFICWDQNIDKIKETRTKYVATSGSYRILDNHKIYTFEPNPSDQMVIIDQPSVAPIPIGHKVFARIMYASSPDVVLTSITLRIYQTGAVKNLSPTNGALAVATGYGTAYRMDSMNFETRGHTAGTVSCGRFQLFDLTAMFGEGLEPTEEECIKIFSLPYYNYNKLDW